VGSCEHLAWSAVAPWDEANADGSLLRSSSPTVVGAFLPDCPCFREASSTLERLAWNFAHVVRFCSLDVVRSPALAFQFGIWRTPASLMHTISCARDQPILAMTPLAHQRAVGPRLRPLMRAECSKLMMAAARLPARRLPAKSQLDLPRVIGLIWFSTHCSRSARRRRSRSA